MANPRTIAKLAERIRERAAEILHGELQDPRASFLTVTRVELASDLLSGKIFYSVYGSDGDKSKAAHMLATAAGWIQRRIAPALHVRRMPHLSWHYDESIERSADMDDLIRRARESDARIREAAAGLDPALGTERAATEPGAEAE